ncbi:MAG: glycosyltransferase family 4 protein [Gammaproteobacteria bacterium]|nr:glycosyltransferase family 4 protein [Gammaproteobacteria bacterium]NNL99702.1 glycosyltransferase family 4 protein [Gammaproteobacteria bacterium]
MPHLVYLVTEDWYFCSHRIGLARAARSAGYDVTVATRVTNHAAEIEGAGLTLESIPFERSLRHPRRDVEALRHITAIYRRLRPDIVHHVALKPVLLGAYPAHRLGIPCVNALTGLGYVFSSAEQRARLLRPLVKAALGRALTAPRAWTLVQNPDDAALIRDQWPGAEQRLSLIRGSGVDVNAFRPVPRASTQAPVVMLVARMLRDKGVVEFVDAARTLRAEGVKARFVLVGDSDNDNPAAIDRQLLQKWQSDNLVEWWGQRVDMPEVYAQADLVCLPSYREGLPKVLLEAAASGLPLVAADVPGSREIAIHEQTGLLVPARDSTGLAAAIKRLIADVPLRRQLGEGARRLVEQAFSIETINTQTLSLYQRVLAGARCSA